MKELIESGNAIPLEMIHTQWHLNVSVPVFNGPVQIQGTSSNMPIWCSSSVTALPKIVGHLSANQLPTFFNLLENLDVTSIPQISNPAVVTKKRGRPKGAPNRTTKRDKSWFEIVEGRKCSNCQQLGHNARICDAPCGNYGKPTHTSKYCDAP